MDKLIWQILFIQLVVLVSFSRTKFIPRQIPANNTTVSKANNPSSEALPKKESETTVGTVSSKISETSGISNSTANITTSNETQTSTSAPPLFNVLKSSDAVLRAVYVASGILLIILIYTFCRLRRNSKKTKWHKYGLLKNGGEVEMMPLGTEEEEDEENTMFDARTFRSDKK